MTSGESAGYKAGCFSHVCVCRDVAACSKPAACATRDGNSSGAGGSLKWLCVVRVGLCYIDAGAAASCCGVRVVLCVRL